MFRTPDREFIFILGHKILIEIDDIKLDKLEADALFNLELITLKSHYPSYDYYKRVFFHECFHALCETLGCQLDHNLEETLANTVSFMFMDFPV